MDFNIKKHPFKFYRTRSLAQMGKLRFSFNLILFKNIYLNQLNYLKGEILAKNEKVTKLDKSLNSEEEILINNEFSLKGYIKLDISLQSNEDKLKVNKKNNQYILFFF